MRFEFKLPDIGEGVVEGEVVKWLVNDGDAVQAEQPVVEVMTDKATVVIPSPKAGKVLERHGKEGEMIKVHSTLLVDWRPRAGLPKPAAASAVQRRQAAACDAVAAPAAEKIAKAPLAGARPFSAHGAGEAGLRRLLRRPPRRLRCAPCSATACRRRRAACAATPVTRKLAAEAGIDLSTVPGSGPAGRVLKSDVRIALVGGNGASRLGSGERAWCRAAARSGCHCAALRKRIAEKMQRSRRTAAHFTLRRGGTDCTRLVEIAQAHQPIARPVRSGRGGAAQDLVPAVHHQGGWWRRLKKFPYLNASVDDETNEIVVKQYFYNLGRGRPRRPTA